VYALPRSILGSLTFWNVSLALSIDGQQTRSFQLDPPGDAATSYNYDRAVLTTSGLSDTPHTARVDVISPSQFIVRLLSTLIWSYLEVSHTDRSIFSVRLSNLLDSGRFID
jgi:hypothetical protein